MGATRAGPAFQRSATCRLLAAWAIASTPLSVVAEEGPSAEQSAAARTEGSAAVWTEHTAAARAERGAARTRRSAAAWTERSAVARALRTTAAPAEHAPEPLPERAAAAADLRRQYQAQADEPTAEGDQPSEATAKAGDPAGENKSGVSPQALELPSGEGTIDGLGESFTPMLATGGASFSLPIQGPPARGAVAPSLAFSHTSGGGQGIAGIGWSVGVPSIQRQTDKGLPQYQGISGYGGSDRFTHNGAELVPIQTGLGGHTPAGALPFRLKLEGSFWRFFYYPEDAEGRRGQWVAQDKEGTTYRFGSIPASRVENDDGVFAWYCSEVIDVHGNRAVYEYFRDLRWVTAPYPHYEGNGKVYLIAILYNEAADGTFRDRIGFEYEGRQDILTSYISGYPVRTVRRLAAVTVDTEYTLGEERRRVRSYVLGYDPASYHSLLTSIQLIGNDGVTAYPPVRLSYTEVPAQSATWVAGHGYLDSTVRVLSPSPDRSVNEGINDLLDVDGDSLPDLFVTDLARNQGEHTWLRNVGGGRFEVWPGGPDVSVSTGERYLYGGAQLSLSNRNVQLLDIDGNGRVDLLHMPRFAQYNYYQLDDRQGEPRWIRCDSYVCGASASSIPLQSRIDFRQSAADLRLLDVNNDHLIDVVMTTNGSTRTWLNLGGRADGQGRSGWGRFGQQLGDGSFVDEALESCPLYKGGYVRFSDPRVQLADMNGDSLQDIVLLERGGIVYWPGRGYGSFGIGARQCASSQVGANRHLAMDGSPYYSDLNLVAMKLADVNGDNLSDLVEVLADSVRIWLNEGGHRFTAPLLVERTPEFFAFSNRLRAADMNGSGSGDLVWGDAGQYRYIDFTAGIQPRLLSRVENGLGKVTTIEWESSTAHAYRLQHGSCSGAGEQLVCIGGTAPQNPAVERQGGWQEQNPFPLQVMARMTVSDSMGSVPGFGEGRYVTEYRYFDPYYDGGEHEFRGFAYVEVKQLGDASSPTSVAKSWFLRGKEEDESLKGVVLRQETLDPGLDSTGVSLLSTTVNQWTVRELEVGLDGRVVRQAYQSQSMSFLYDTHMMTEPGFVPSPQAYELRIIRTIGTDGLLDSGASRDETFLLYTAPEAVTQTAALLDAFGNQVEQLGFGVIEPGQPAYYLGDERFTFTEWSFNADTWVHRPVHKWVTGADVSVRYNETFYCYDYYEPCGSGALDLGDVTREEALVERDPVGGRRRFVRVEHDYDAFGHAIRTVTGGRQERRFVYGGPRDRFFVHVSSEQVVVDATTTLVTGAQWDPGFGKIIRHEDYNFAAGDSRAVTTVAYDPLGRAQAVHRPHVLPEPLPGGMTAADCLAKPTIRIEYRFDSPLSSAAVFRQERECHDDLLVSVSFVDGLGRARQTLHEDTGDRWVLSGHIVFDRKGGKRDVYLPFFATVDTAAYVRDQGPEPWPWWQAVTNPAGRPHTTESRDAYTRPVLTVKEDQVEGDPSFTIIRYHALSHDRFDENDTDASGSQQALVYYGTYSTRVDDGLGRLLQVVERIDLTPGGARTWHYQYNPIDSLISTHDPVGNEKRQWFDSLGRRLEFDDPNAGRWSFRYDDADNMLERIDGNGNKTVYTHDGAGRQLTEDYYDATGAPFPGMESGVHLHYDHAYCPVGDAACEARVGGAQSGTRGLLSWVEDLTGVSFFSYDSRTRQVFRTRELDGIAFSTRLTHDAMDRQTSLTYPAPAGAVPTTVTFAYSTRGLLDAVPGYVDRILYNAAGQRIEVQYADGVGTVRRATHDARLRPKTLTVEQRTTGDVLLAEAYELDRVGNILRITQDPNASYPFPIAPSSREMQYDALYQLLGVTGSFGTARYEYDEVANLIQRSVDDGSGDGGAFFDETPGTYSYDSGKPYAVSFVQKSVASPGPSPGNFAYFDYDDAGNLIEAVLVFPDGSTRELRLRWDALERLVYAERYHDGATARVAFGYDFAGARVIKRVLEPDGSPAGVPCGQGGSVIDPSVSDRTTLYIDPTSEVRGCQLTRFVVADGRRIARVVRESLDPTVYPSAPPGPYTLFFHHDHLGSTSTVTKVDGTVVNHTTYHPYGSLEADYANPELAGFSADYKYTDKELDEEIGLVFFGARYYWPELGRWVSPDPLFLQAPETALDRPLERNLYAYVSNNPFALVDPSGLQAEEPEPAPAGTPAAPAAGAPRIYARTADPLKHLRLRGTTLADLSDDEYQVVRRLDELIGVLPGTLLKAMRSRDESIKRRATQVELSTRSTRWYYESVEKMEDGGDIFAQATGGKNEVVFFKNMTKVLPGKVYRGRPAAAQGYRYEMEAGEEVFRYAVSHEARHTTPANINMLRRYDRFAVEMDADGFGRSLLEYWDPGGPGGE